MALTSKELHESALTDRVTQLENALAGLQTRFNALENDYNTLNEEMTEVRGRVSYGDEAF